MPSHNSTRRVNNKNSTSATNIVRDRSSRKREAHNPAEKNDRHQYPYPEVESDESNSPRSNDGGDERGTSSQPSAPTKSRNRGREQKDQPHLCNSRPILRPLPLPQSQPLLAGADQHHNSTEGTTEAYQQEQHHLPQQQQQYLDRVPSSAWNNSQSSLAGASARPYHNHHQYGAPSYAVPSTHTPHSPHPTVMLTMSGSGFATIDGGAPHRWGSSGTVLTSRDWGQMGALTLYDSHAMAVATTNPMAIAHIEGSRTTARGGVDTRTSTYRLGGAAPFGAGGGDESNAAAAATSVSSYEKHIYDHRGVIVEGTNGNSKWFTLLFGSAKACALLVELERLDAEMLVESRAEAAKSKHRRIRESKEARVPFLAVIRDRPLHNCIRVTNVLTFILGIVAAVCLFAFAAVIYPARLLLENAAEQCR